MNSQYWYDDDGDGDGDGDYDDDHHHGEGNFVLLLFFQNTLRAGTLEKRQERSKTVRIEIDSTSFAPHSCHVTSDVTRPFLNASRFGSRYTKQIRRAIRIFKNAT